MNESSEKLNNQALMFAHKGDFEEAIACLKRAVLIEKENYLLWFNLGLIYRDAGKLELARESLEYAFKMNPDDQETIETLSAVLISLEEFELALEYCYEGMNINCYNAHFFNNAGVVFFNSNRYDVAAEYFENAVCLDSFYYDALFNLRDTYEELGNKAGYEECCRMLKMIPKSRR